ncbi:MAG: PAS domain S-box protein [Mariprofundus sp.]
MPISKTESLIYTGSLAAIFISGIALIGWWTDHATLVAYLPGIGDMTFNTALCFMLVALACFLSRKDSSKTDRIKYRIKLTAGATVGLFALLSLLQDAFGLHFGIDNLLFDSFGYGLTSPWPGRMSPNTATGFLLSGIILISLTTQKQVSRITTLTHTLMLLLAAISLLGIGMNVLISEVPEGFAHFASMSLFTAIAFLLLSIAFIAMFQQQYQSHSILHSGIHLMYRLKYPSKFALISLVFIIPLAILMWNKLALLEQHVDQAKLKIIGIEHILKTSQLIKAVPEHRGMRNAHLSNPDVFSSTMLQKTAEVDQLFAANDQMDQRHAALIHIPDDWSAITARWASIKGNHLDAMASWRLHTEIIALLGKHLRDIGAATQLSYDGDPMIHNLLAAQLEVLPQLFERVGQLRGQGAGFMARQQITASEQLMLGSMVSQISLLLKESEQLLSMALQHKDNGVLRDLGLEYAKLIQHFLDTAKRQLIKDKAFSISAEAYFKQATRALASGYAFSHASMQLMQALLEQRIRDSITSQYTITLSAMLILLLIIFLFAAFYQSVINTIRALGQASEQMKTGGVNALTELPARDEMGDVVHSFNAIAEELMRVSSHMSAVVDHAVDGIITIDQHGEIKSFNPASEYIFGYSSDEVVGQNITMLMPEQYRERHQAGLQRYCETGEGLVIGKPLEVQGIRNNGDEFPMELSINAMLIDEQQLFIGMVRDTTEHRELENQLRHAQKMEAVGALVGGVAHNFNNLLAGIVGKAYLAKIKAKDRPEILTYLESIEAISVQAGDMVKQLLTFAHKDFFSKQQQTPLSVLIKEGFKTAKLGIAEDINLTLNISDPDLIVSCDANQVQQVLMNMMNNARDAVADSADKRVQVSLERCTPDPDFFHRQPELAQGEYACLSISDNGHGMDAETRQKIFDPFYTTKKVGKGTGLGLSSAFGTISSHGGAIEVDSWPAEGTTFRVYLPLIQSSDADDKVNKQEQVVHSTQHQTLLLVDDEPLIIQSMQEVLEDLGYQVITARNGAEGLECFKQHQDHIAAIITDVVMPVMGGVDMFRSIRLSHASIPTIFVTGYDQGNVQLSADEAVNTMVISKPVQIAELSQILQKILT